MRFSGSDLPKKVLFSYLLDYLLIVILFVVFEILDAVEPFHQPFSLSNYTLQYPYAVHERVPIGAAIAVAIVGPFVVIAIYSIVIDGYYSHYKEAGSKRRQYDLKQRLWELNCGVLGLLLASASAFVITNIMKNATGKPRPDFIARCLPPLDATDPKPFGLSNNTICTQTDQAIMKDGYRSFPSGHSSSSFAGLFYLTLYLCGKLHFYDTRGFAWKWFVVLIPTIGASLIAISRIEDARHHPFDVLFGSALGILCAWIAYRQYFPPLSEPWRKGRAYPMRTWGSPSESWGEEDKRWRGGSTNRAVDNKTSGGTAYENFSTGTNALGYQDSSMSQRQGDIELQGQSYAMDNARQVHAPPTAGNTMASSDHGLVGERHDLEAGRL